MIFLFTWQQVMDDLKTQTSRLPKPGEELRVIESPFGGYKPLCVHVGERIVWEIGSTYAVQPGRGVKAVGRIKITDIAKRDVRQFTTADFKREGFSIGYDFFAVWCRMHDKPALRKIKTVKQQANDADLGGAQTYSLILSTLESRPAERYLAWVLQFERVKSTG